MTFNRKSIQVVKEIDSEKETEIICSSLIQREDHDFRDQIEKISCTALFRVWLCLVRMFSMFSNIFDMRLIETVSL